MFAVLLAAPDPAPAPRKELLDPVVILVPALRPTIVLLEPVVIALPASVPMQTRFAALEALWAALCPTAVLALWLEAPKAPDPTATLND